jgi:hypothetical protein
MPKVVDVRTNRMERVVGKEGRLRLIARDRKAGDAEGRSAKRRQPELVDEHEIDDRQRNENEHDESLDDRSPCFRAVPTKRQGDQREEERGYDVGRAVNPQREPEESRSGDQPSVP